MHLFCYRIFGWRFLKLDENRHNYQTLLLWEKIPLILGVKLQQRAIFTSWNFCGRVQNSTEFRLKMIFSTKFYLDSFCENLKLINTRNLNLSNTSGLPKQVHSYVCVLCVFKNLFLNIFPWKYLKISYIQSFDILKVCNDFWASIFFLKFWKMGSFAIVSYLDPA